MNQLEIALLFITEAHKGQLRKCGILPFAFHPIEVCKKLHAWGVRDEDLLVAAILHDIVEDTSVTAGTLYSKFSMKATELVLDVTRGPEEDKLSYIESFEHKSFEANLLKMADRICNVTDFYLAGKKYAVTYFERTAKLPEYLSAARGRMEKTDEDANSVIHYIALKNWQDMKEMLEHSIPFLN